MPTINFCLGIVGNGAGSLFSEGSARLKVNANEHSAAAHNAPERVPFMPTQNKDGEAHLRSAICEPEPVEPAEPA